MNQLELTLLSYWVFWWMAWHASSYLTFYKSQNRFKYAGYSMSVLHALVSLFWSISLIYDDVLNRRYLSTTYITENRDEHISLLLFGSGYFIVHTLHILMQFKITAFIIHHVLTISALLISVYYGQIASILIFSYILAEITNPLQLTWQLSREFEYIRLFRFITPIFTKSFVIMRCIIIPVISYSLNRCVIYTSTLSPNVKIILVQLSVCMNIAGFVWSYLLMVGYAYFQKHNKD